MAVLISRINDLTKRVGKVGYEKFLRQLHLKNVRAFKDQKVRFDFPVTAVIGTNGGGKSTILGAAALAYKDIKPGDFFPKSNVGDDTMSNWRIDYDLTDRTDEKIVKLRYAKFTAAKWRRENLVERSVLFFPIGRTVPAGEQSRYKKYIGIYKAEAPVIELLPLAVRRAAGRILGKDLSGYKVAKLHSGDNDSILLGAQRGNDYSQFHFGAGEASVIDMVLKITRAEKETLVLIEEIENGLHPLATERMIEFLLDVADTKRIQVIFTTHSEYAIKSLPNIAVWACIDGEAVAGKLSIESLRAITGAVQTEKVIFVEDVFAKEWVEDIIRQYHSEFISAVEVHITGGHSRARSTAEGHNDNPAIRTKAIAVLDGDAPVETSANVIKLPGGVPESEIYGYVSQHAEELASLIQQRCQCPAVGQDRLIAAVKRIEAGSDNPHGLFRELGDSLNFTSELVVRRGFISIYNERNRDGINQINSLVSGFLPPQLVNSA